jgi:hypothetical protein
MRRSPAQFTLRPHLFREGDVFNADDRGWLLVKKIDINKIIKCLHFIIPFLYIMMGCVLFTDLFPDINRSSRIIFGIIIIIYGVFRVYKAYEKIRNNT